MSGPHPAGPASTLSEPRVDAAYAADAVQPSTQPGLLRGTRGGHVFWMTPERALWWPAQATLFIADPHFGKAAVYRALGQPVPGGTTARTLAQLDHAMSRFALRRLVVLGDFMHARQAHQPSVLAALHAWRARWLHVTCVLVRGNHDDRAGDPPASLQIDVVDEPWCVDGVACCHIPPDGAGSDAPDGVTYTLAGHIHPVVRLWGRGRDKLRLPCFDMGPQVGVLPAFGAFTGGWLVPAQEGHLIGIVAGDAVLAHSP